jgi:hypothetical protein
MDFTRQLLTLNHCIKFLEALKAAGMKLHKVAGYTTITGVTQSDIDGGHVGERIRDLDRQNWRPRGFQDAVDYFNAL